MREDIVSWIIAIKEHIIWCDDVVNIDYLFTAFIEENILFIIVEDLNKRR